jgi:hypothetical protein
MHVLKKLVYDIDDTILNMPSITMHHHTHTRDLLPMTQFWVFNMLINFPGILGKNTVDLTIVGPFMLVCCFQPFFRDMFNTGQVAG